MFIQFVVALYLLLHIQNTRGERLVKLEIPCFGSYMTTYEVRFAFVIHHTAVVGLVLFFQIHCLLLIIINFES